MQVRMQISGLMVDPVTNMPIVILKDDSGEHVLPIWVGVYEANAIALKLEDIAPPRPMTHDLLHDVVGQLGAEIRRILISDLRDNTYYARVDLERKGEQLSIDARPSDALALALRADAPVFVETSVLELAENGTDSSSEAERLKRWFENLDPEDFSKYEM
ncbi:MAG: bifunctional nuclease family protein [Acidobacteria bacterium]|nr:bifunctional nuclease family protein [Acidobacteriota bacterium]